jgi:hypothetical protein
MSEDGNLDSRDKASADRMDHACGVHRNPVLNSVAARRLVGGKLQKNLGYCMQKRHAPHIADGCSTAK